MAQALKSFSWTVDAADVLRVADILQDPNPIHLDEAAAKMAGLPHAINQGPANLAYAVNMLQQSFPGARILSLESRYLANVLVGDRITAEGSVVALAGGVVTCEFRVVNGAGDNAVVGTARLHLGEEA